jgi:hypothetical protein
MPGFLHKAMELLGWFEHDTSDLGALDTQANGRSFRLLINNLSAAQRHQFDQHNYFDVVGSKSGARYRIRHGHMMNVERIDKNGRRLVKLCFAPRGRLPVGDIMLAQKIALELFEPDAISVANVSGPLWDDP